MTGVMKKDPSGLGMVSRNEEGLIFKLVID